LHCCINVVVGIVETVLALPRRSREHASHDDLGKLDVVATDTQRNDDPGSGLDIGSFEKLLD
jgi:hypothetical protein